MEAIVNTFIAALNLIEAEGRTLRRYVIRLGIGLGAVVCALLFVLGGYLLATWGIYLFLVYLVTYQSLAAIITALISFGAAGGIAWLGYRIVK